MTDEESTVNMWKMNGTRLGKYLEHRGRFEAALSIYRRLSSSPPTPSEAFNIGNCLYRLEHYNQAVPYLRTAADSPNATRQYVDRYLNAIDFAKKHEDELEALNSQSALASEVAKRLARALERSGDAVGALDVYLASRLSDDAEVQDKIAELTPATTPVWQRLERHYATIDGHRNDPTWWRKRGDMLFEAHKFTEAGEAYKQLLSVDDSHAWDAYCTGITLELADDPEFKKYYALAQNRDSELQSQLYGIGVFHQKALRFVRAGREYRAHAEVTRAPSARTELLRRAALAFQGAFELGEAEAALMQAIDLRPRNLELHALLSLNFFLRNQFSNAAISATRARQLGDTSPETRELQFLSLINDGQYQLAVSNYLGESIENSQPIAQDDNDDHNSIPIEVDVPKILPDMESHRQWSQVLLDRGHTSDSADLLTLGMERYQAHFDSADALLAAKLLMATNRSEAAARIIHQSLRYTDPIPKIHGNPKVPGLGTIFMYRAWLESEPIRPSDILFESNLGMSVDCNPLAIYRHIRDKHQDSYTFYWSVDKDAAVPADVWQDPNTVIVRKNTSRYVKLLATARYLVNNSTFPTYFVRRPDQEYLMTWHGTPFKTLGRDQPELLGHANMTRNLLQASLVIHPNRHTQRILMEGCDVADLTGAKSVITGYPRNDALTLPRVQQRKKPFVLYAPTWRPDTDLAEQATFITEVVEAFEKHGYEIGVRAHHYVESKLAEFAPNVNTVPRAIPTNDLLPKADVLVTDYSSIYFDFAVTRRPIIFYVPDWHKYTSVRGAYFTEEHLPGLVCRSVASLQESVTMLANNPANACPTELFVEEFAPLEDGKATERAVDLLLAKTSSDDPCNPNAEQQNVLFRQSFIPNGMTSSFVNLARALPRQKYRPYVLTDAAAVQSDQGRTEMVRSLPRDVGVIGRVGRHAVSRKEHLAIRALSQDSTLASAEAKRIRDDAFEFEASRVTGNAQFAKVIEYDGYSSFMANVVLGHANRTNITGLLLHSDLEREAALRFPEIYRIVDQISEFDCVAAVSPSLAEINQNGLRSLGVGNLAIGHVRNLVDSQSLREGAAEPFAPDLQHFIESSDKLIVSLGRLSPEKNLPDTLRAFARVLTEHPNARLLIMGDGPELAKLRALAATLLPEASYRFAGHRSNPFPYLATADTLLMSSFHEGQPMVILEALTLNTPTVAMRIPSLADFEHLFGVVVSDFNVEAFAAKIGSVLSNPPVVDFNPDSYVHSSLTDFDLAFSECR
ncbi:MAG: CDP-glycerol glycerophosphotransferase family protein [Actinomycetota bacterium]